MMVAVNKDKNPYCNKTLTLVAGDKLENYTLSQVFQQGQENSMFKHAGQNRSSNEQNENIFK
jgi:hypothetical protein